LEGNGLGLTDVQSLEGPREVTKDLGNDSRCLDPDWNEHLPNISPEYHRYDNLPGEFDFNLT
jgi:hypothetical protein